MAEYIDRALVLRELERYKKGITVNIKAELKALPIEDVIERSKINEAKEIAEDSIRACFKLGLNERAFGMREILEVFERVIGE
jgi:hypothetical protein